MILARGQRVRLRRLEPADLAAAAPFDYPLFVADTGAPLDQLLAVHADTGFWTAVGGVAAIEAGGRFVGTIQFYRSGPALHGYDIGYAVHAEADRGKGYAAEALRLFSDALWAERADCRRLQLLIAVGNAASVRVAEACGYEREGVLRKASYTVLGEPEDCFVYSLIR